MLAKMRLLICSDVFLIPRLAPASQWKQQAEAEKKIGLVYNHRVG